MIALAIWFGFGLRKEVWFGSVVAALKLLKSTVEDASNLEAGGLADEHPLDDRQRRS